MKKPTQPIEALSYPKCLQDRGTEQTVWLLYEGAVEYTKPKIAYRYLLLKEPDLNITMETLQSQDAWDADLLEGSLLFPERIFPCSPGGVLSTTLFFSPENPTGLPLKAHLDSSLIGYLKDPETCAALMANSIAVRAAFHKSTASKLDFAVELLSPLRSAYHSSNEDQKTLLLAAVMKFITKPYTPEEKG